MKFFCTLLVLVLVSVLDSALSACPRDATLTGQSGIIKSDNYPSSYPNSRDCTWRITVVGKGIKFAFSDQFGIENHASCGYDFVQVYSVTTRGAASIGKYCGTSSPGTVSINSNKALIKFVSDSSQTARGFSLTYTAITDGGWSDWSEYRATGSCSTTCGNGTLTEQRNRTCNNPATSGGGTPCSGSSLQTRTVPCFVRECPIDGGWSVWEVFNTSQCSVSCGSFGGTRMITLSRTCSNPEPQFGGQACNGPASNEQYEMCTVNPCPVDGGWSSWELSNTSQCSVSCGSGGSRIRTLSRFCDNPEPQFGGQSCNGSSSRTEVQMCSADPCPVNGEWGDWGNWTRQGACSVTCGDGLIAEKRNRTCDNPEPLYGGEQCVGQSEEGRSVECSMAECNGICGIDGEKHIYTRDFSKYYECIDNQPVLKSCSYGFKFDATSASCVKICTSFGTQTVGYPSDCFKYVQCVWGMNIVMNCPPGTAWSRSLNLCDHTGVADCVY